MTNITMTQPVIPLAFHKYKVSGFLSRDFVQIVAWSFWILKLTSVQEVLCYTCRVSQDLR